MKVTVYSTPTCPFCKQTKAFLKENNIEFADVDVSTDPKQAQEMIDKSGQMGVPVTVIVDDKSEEHIIIGFDKKALSDVLGI